MGFWLLRLLLGAATRMDVLSEEKPVTARFHFEDSVRAEEQVG
jgi:hypothetical protein